MFSRLINSKPLISGLSDPAARGRRWRRGDKTESANHDEARRQLSDRLEAQGFDPLQFVRDEKHQKYLKRSGSKSVAQSHTNAQIGHVNSHIS